ncbi:MAG: glucokinase [Desulfovibrionaceae bacterium]
MYHILAADIGGTHCRLAYFTGSSHSLLLQNSYSLPTAHVPDSAALLELFATQVCPLPCRLQDMDMLAVAVAGPLQGALRARTSNAALEIDLSHFAAQGPRARVLCNDFVAQAWACCSPAVEAARCVFAGEKPQVAQGPSGLPLLPRAVIGAGTGLGAAAVYPAPHGRPIALASEAGHAPFPFSGGGPRGRTERAYEDFLLRACHVPYATVDIVLSGRGLCLLHQFLHGQILDAHDIAARYLHGDSDTCVYFSTFLGRMCRQWVLTTLCTGGLYITGGVAMKNPVLVQCPAFAEAFYDSQNFGSFLRSIPVFLNTNAGSGLWGAAWAGLQALEEQQA